MDESDSGAGPTELFEDPIRQALAELIRELFQARLIMDHEIGRIEDATDDILDVKADFLAVTRRRYAHTAVALLYIFLHDERILEFCPEIESKALLTPLHDLLSAL